MNRRQGITALGARIHVFVRPEARDAFTALFRDVLDCDIVERDFGLPHPILLVQFPDRSGFSIEFSDLATADPPGDTLTDASAGRGAWIEFRTTDVAGYQQRLRQAGIRSSVTPAALTRTSALPAARCFDCSTSHTTGRKPTIPVGAPHPDSGANLVHVDSGQLLAH